MSGTAVLSTSDGTHILMLHTKEEEEEEGAAYVIMGCKVMLSSGVYDSKVKINGKGWNLLTSQRQIDCHILVVDPTCCEEQSQFKLS